MTEKSNELLNGLHSYHFDVGNSTDGPIGYCARVWAHSKEEALSSLREELIYQGNETQIQTGRSAIEYLNVYFNEDAVQLSHIDEFEEVEE